MYENILYEVSEGIATITLNRPDKLNAYTTEMGDEVYDAFARAHDDSAISVVILTGAGRGFCAGVDLEHLKAVASTTPARLDLTSHTSDLHTSNSAYPPNRRDNLRRRHRRRSSAPGPTWSPTASVTPIAAFTVACVSTAPEEVIVPSLSRL